MLADLAATLRSGAMIFARSTQRRMAYPLGMLIEVASFLAIFVLTLLLWRAVRQAGGDLGMLWKDLLRYLCVAFAVNFTFEFFSTQFQQSVRSGSIAIDLLKPVPVTWLHFCSSMSWGFIQALYVLLALIVFHPWLPKLTPVFDLATLAPLGLSLCLATFLQFSIFFFFAQGAFITQFGYGVRYTRMALHQIFCGAFAPLTLFPEGLRPWAEALPFRHVVDTPVRIFLGMASPEEIPGLLLGQLLWGIGLFIAGQLLFRALLGRAQVQGG